MHQALLVLLAQLVLKVQLVKSELQEDKVNKDLLVEMVLTALRALVSMDPQALQDTQDIMVLWVPLVPLVLKVSVVPKVLED